MRKTSKVDTCLTSFSRSLTWLALKEAAIGGVTVTVCQVRPNDEWSMIKSAGALSSFIPEGRERRQVMEAVGDACEQQGQMEAARELYLAAPNPCAALRIINRQLSDLIKPAITDQAASKPATASQV